LRSTPGRHVEVRTVGSAKTARKTSAGWTDMRSAIATPRRTIQPHVEKTDMYMWSSTKTWSRSMARRSRYSGRSWWAMVAVLACRRATCDSRAIVILSRKRRCTRVLTVARTQVATAHRARPTAAPTSRVRSPAKAPSPRILRRRATRASGTAASWESAKERTIIPGSWR
jgi:hypothetical protein